MNAIAWSIVACEILFWVFIIIGLITRYIVKQEKLGLVLLAMTPVVDVLLLVITGVDLYMGATATKAHAIAAVYIGISIAFGKSMIQWADERFQYYIVKQGEKPIKRVGLDYAKYYFKSRLRHLLAYCIGTGLLLGIIFFVNDPTRTEALSSIFKLWSLVLGIDLIISISYFIWRK
ncbi:MULTISPECIES: hypothetical protein [Bacillus]|uniref:hypothetical protein n=1 Tax=Bacillus TaxID=1386 RepID=UPI0002DC5F2A|nr:MULTISPECIES: hypothetical protein [Bacillus]